MQFINGGPDIPIELLNEHQEGKVIFFCGAGISYPAGLPNFKGLVDRIYEKIGDVRSQAEDNAYYNSQFDTMLNLLQNRIIVGRKSIYNAIFDTLKPCYSLPEAVDTHVALLKLAITKENKTHLITTNFDRVFEKAKQQISKKINSQSAPSLPIPDSKWDSLVYLHGVLSSDEDISIRKNQYDVYDEKTDNLIATSGDFGQAYLVQRWAARFVSQIFENYTVCFVGYSLNDPILRYMTDALAANQDKHYKSYIFTDYNNEEEKNIKQQEWDIRGVIPIFYFVNQHDHRYLHQTLKAWGNHYEKNYITVRQKIIDEYIDLNPEENTKENDFIGRLLWALSDNTANTVRYFSHRVPLPNFDWLFAFQSYEQGKNKKASTNNNDFFFTNSVNSLFDDRQSPSWTVISGCIADWLIRQINNPEVFKFILDRGQPLHFNFKEKIRNTLSDISEMKVRNYNDGLAKIKSEYPDVIPSDFMYHYWNLLTNNQICFQSFMDNRLYRWQTDFRIYDLTPDLVLNLRKILSPKIRLTGLGYFREINFSDTPENWHIKFRNLSFGIDNDFIQIIAKKDQSVDYYLTFLQEFLLALKSGLQLLQILKKDRDTYYDDESFRSLKSIKPSSQDSHLGKSIFDKRGFHPNNSDHGVLLLVLIRDFWLKILEQDPNKAKKLALSWFDEPYAVFKRLALYAATKDSNIPDKVWVSCLLDNKSEYLWSLETQREKFRVLAERGQGLNKAWQVKLEKAILKGRPPFNGLSEEQRRADIWHHLLTLQGSGVELSSTAQDFVNRVQADYPQWTKPNKTHEFTGGYVYPAQNMDSLPKDYHDPQTESEMHQFLLDRIDQFSDNNNTMESWQYQRTWSNYCGLHAQRAFSILSQLLDEQYFIPNLWRDFFDAINNSDILKALWQPLSKLIQGLSQDHIKAIAPICASWLFFCVDNNKEEIISAKDHDFLPVFERIFSVISENENIESEPIQDIYNWALNCSIGRLTLSLIRFYFKNKLYENSLIPENIKLYFNAILVNIRPDFIYGHVMIAIHLYEFYYIDPQWTKQYLLPLLDWDKYEEAWVIWCGFCINKKIDNQLLSEIKPYFIATASHYDDLQKGGRDYGRCYVEMLRYITLYQSNIFTDTELRHVYNALPSEALHQIIQSIGSYLPEKQEELNKFWKDRLQPFFIKIWPKSKDKFTNQLVDALLNLCIQSKEAFPIAMETFGEWLNPRDVQYLMMPLSLIENFKLCEKFPKESLALLGKIITNPINSLVPLSKLLQKIKDTKPELEQDQRFQQLLLYCL